MTTLSINLYQSRQADVRATSGVQKGKCQVAQMGADRQKTREDRFHPSDSAARQKAYRFDLKKSGLIGPLLSM